MKKQLQNKAMLQPQMIIMLLVFAVLSTASIFAQAPQKFNYQTVVRNTSGVPQTSQVYSVRFSIRDLSAAGTIVYQETHTVTTNNFGLFNAAVGGGTVVSGTFSSINWGTGDKYLQVEYKQGSNPYSDLGATQLISVPFALYAANGGGVSGSGTLNYLSKFTPTGTALGNSQVFDNGTSVGIGTASPHPSALLHVESSTQGVLIPRMDSTTRNAILNPADGLMVMDTTDSTNYALYAFHAFSNTWKPLNITIINNFGDGGGDTAGNTLDMAYDESTPGAGRIITVDAGAVEMNGNGASVALDVSNTTKHGIEVSTTTGNAVDATATGGSAFRAAMGGNGSALKATSNVVSARDLIYADLSGTASGNWYDTSSHAGMFQVSTTGNPRPALMGSNAGTSFGVVGTTALFTPPVDFIPRAGVGGFSMAESGTKLNGVTGFSRLHRGVYGRTSSITNWLLSPDTITCGVYGIGLPEPGTISGGTANYVGVAGKVEGGIGVVGVNQGDGHGVHGVTKGGIGGTASQAGVWGLVQEGDWDDHVTDFPLLDADATTKKGLVGVLAQSKSNVALWAEGQDKAGIVASVGSKSGSTHISSVSKTAIIALARHGAGSAALFRQDTISTAPAVRILSQSSTQGLDIAHGGTGVGAKIIKYDTTSTMDALYVENKGGGFAANFKNTKSSNPSQTLFATNDGLGSAGIFIAEGNNANLSPALKGMHYGNGAAGFFEIVDSTAGPTNNNPVVAVKGNHKGGGVRVELSNALNHQPAFSATTITSRLAVLESTGDFDTTGVLIQYGGRANAVKIENTRAAIASAHTEDTSAALSVTTSTNVAAVFANESTFPSIAHGLPFPASYFPSAGVVNITSASPGQTCLVVSPTHYTGALDAYGIPIPAAFKAKAAVFNGPIEVDGDIESAGGFNLGGTIHITNSVYADDSVHCNSLTTNAIACDELGVTGATAIGGTLSVAGITTMSGLSVSGSMDCTGSVSANIKNFRIEHPLKPNYYLQHASIESNEAVNVYSGNVTTDANGYATVILPDYVIAINTDYRYQLTVLGQNFARAIVSEEIGNSDHFVIRTDQPQVKVSWSVTGVRKDKWMLEHPMQVELPKQDAPVR